MGSLARLAFNVAERRLQVHARRGRSLQDHPNKLSTAESKRGNGRRTGLLPATDNIGPDLSPIIYYTLVPYVS